MPGTPTVEIKGKIYRFGKNNAGTILITAPSGDLFSPTTQVVSVSDDSLGVQWTPSSKLIANGRQIQVTIHPVQDVSVGAGFGPREVGFGGLGDSLAAGSPAGGAGEIAYQGPNAAPTGSVTITMTGSPTDAPTSLVVPGVAYAN